MTGLDLPVGRPAASVRIIELGDELSLFNAATGEAHSLNRTAADVIALADGISTVGQLIGTIARAYAVEPSEIERGIRAVIEQLTEAGVLVPAR